MEINGGDNNMEQELIMFDEPAQEEAGFDNMALPQLDLGLDF